ncbi:sigma-54 interaction domain-containing protein [Natranaerobius trueperi]|uniref:Sigma-54-dependent Fis family transcriptional regulator n=1 Tax=Natranaerobius trueperi TaxID=759412 RepID=A0A226C1T5_9FIRM|nr:sigma 54-interacting transcriptional regulator [Natranaerobius trueperi]OWZ84564.1 sigma-54-dependent Fis family transcriptional regulator [Natranaerobius trueperi]
MDNDFKKDISESSLRNIDLFESMQAVLSTVDEGIHIIDQKGYTVFYNQAASRLDNLLPEEVLHRHLFDVFPNLTEDTSTLLKVLKSHEPILNQHQTFTNFKGEKITTINSTLPLFENDKVVGALEISKDITHVKELSEKVNLLQQELYKIQSSEQTYERNTRHQVETNPGTQHTFSNIIYESEKMEQLVKLAKRVSHTDSPILVYGDSGTGKELLVQAMHNEAIRKDGPFLSQNCAALPGNLLDNVLFGTVSGTALSAENKPGLFELADGGTLFLDEITSLSYETQTKLLQALEEGGVRRIGDTEIRPVNVKVFAAMDQHPPDALRDNLLRKDLYYRLNAISLKIPSLAERKEDIPILARYFLDKYKKKLNSPAKNFDTSVLELFKKHNWPGNVRELEYVIEGAVTLATDKTVQLKDLPPHLQELGAHTTENLEDDLKIQPLRDAIQSVEKQLIEKALNSSGGNISWAAQLLQIPRQTLQYKMKNYGFKS